MDDKIKNRNELDVIKCIFAAVGVIDVEKFCQVGIGLGRKWFFAAFPALFIFFLPIVNSGLPLVANLLPAFLGHYGWNAVLLPYYDARGIGIPHGPQKAQRLPVEGVHTAQ